MKQHKRSPEELKTLVENVQSKIDGGMPVTEAIDSGGFQSRSHFYNARAKYFGSRKTKIETKPRKYRKLKIKNNKASYEAIPLATGGGDFELRGSPEAIARFIQAMSAKGGHQ